MQALKQASYTTIIIFIHGRSRSRLVLLNIYMNTAIYDFASLVCFKIISAIIYPRQKRN